MSTINKSSIIAGLVPNVYINKITLESTAVPIVERNPHIETKEELDALDMAFKKSFSSQPMTVKVDLVVKELANVEGSILSTWFNKEDFLKYINIYVAQSISPNVTNLMSVSANESTIPAKSNFKGLEIKVLPLYGDLNETHSSRIGKKYKSVDDSGNIVYDFPFTVKFLIKDDNPKHLAYFAACGFDFQALFEDYNLDNNETANIQGKRASEIVINNNRVVSTSNVVLDPFGNVWAGAVHFTNNGTYASGAEPGEHQDWDLSLVEVPNTVVQDYRQVHRVGSIENMLQDKLDQFLPTMKLKQFGSPPDFPAFSAGPYRQIKKTPYFSNLDISRDIKGGVNLLFSLNFRKALIENSRFPGLYYHKDSRISAEVMDSSLIRSFVITRRRLKQVKHKEGEHYVDYYKYIRQPAPPTVIVRSSDEFGELRHISALENKKTQKTQSKRGGVKELVFSLEHTTDDIRFFSVTDNLKPLLSSLNSKITKGFYYYSVEMEIEDGAYSWLESVADNLEEALLGLKTFYNLALTGKTFSTEEAEIKNAFGINREDRHLIRKMTDNFDHINNRFSQEFIDHVNVLYPPDDLSSFSPWEQALSTFITTLHIMSATQIINLREIETTLFAMVDPNSGTLKGIDTLIGLISQILLKMQNMLSGGGSHATVAFNPTRTGKRNIKNFKIAQSWTKSEFILDVDEIEPGVGFDYLSIPGQKAKKISGTSLRYLTEADILKRTKLETEKYFSSQRNPSGKISLANKFTSFIENESLETKRYRFLTLSNVYMPKTTTGSKKTNVLPMLQVGASILDENKYIKMAADIYNYNKFKSSPFALSGKPSNQYGSNKKKGKAAKSNVAAGIQSSLSIGNAQAGIITTTPMVLSMPSMTPMGITHSLSAIATYPIPNFKFFLTAIPALINFKWASLSPEAMDEQLLGVDRISYEDVLSSYYIAPEGGAQSTEDNDDNSTSLMSYKLIQNTFPAAFTNKISNFNLSSINDFNLENPKNILDQMLVVGAGKPTMQADAVPFSGVSVSTSAQPTSLPTFSSAYSAPQITKTNATNYIVNNIPNQTAALFISASPKTAPQTNFKFQSLKIKTDPLKNAKILFMMYFNFFNIVEVEVLSGYRQNKDGEIMINEPIFKPLVGNSIQAGGNLLCRIKKFNYSQIGIGGFKNLSLPIVDEYFVLRLKSKSKIELDSLEEEMGDRLKRSRIVSSKYDNAYITTNLVSGGKNKLQKPLGGGISSSPGGGTGGIY